VTRVFLDTNVALYAAEGVGEKSEAAANLLELNCVISVQVLNEFIRVATRKYKSPLPTAELALRFVRTACEVVPLTAETHDMAVTFMNRYKLNIFDANIIAAAELSGCDILYTEDLNHGQTIGRIRIVNPFVET
jgi:predicted nucleic acid-binding protein